MATDTANFTNFVYRVHVNINDVKKVIEENFLSKLEEKKRCKKYPDWDIARNTPEARLVKEQRELLYAEDNVERKLEELKRKRKSLDAKWKELENKQKDLHDSFIKFDAFIKDNEGVRRRSKLQIEKEIKRQKQLEIEIEQLNAKLIYHNKFKEVLEKNLKKYSIYSEFLERTVNETDSFKSVQDIFDYYNTLEEATKVLTTNLENKLKTMKDIEEERHQMIEARAQTLVSLNNKLALLHQEYETSKSRVKRWETMVSNVKDAATERKLELIRVRASCWNMYEQICQKSGISAKKYMEDQDNIRKQFEHIKDAIVENQQVLEDVKKKENDTKS